MKTFSRHGSVLSIVLTIIILAVFVLPQGVFAGLGDETNTRPAADSQTLSWGTWKELCPLGSDLKTYPQPNVPAVLVVCVLQGTDTFIWKQQCPVPIYTVFEPGVGTHAVCEPTDTSNVKKRRNSDDFYDQLIE